MVGILVAMLSVLPAPWIFRRLQYIDPQLAARVFEAECLLSAVVGFAVSAPTFRRRALAAAIYIPTMAIWLFAVAAVVGIYLFGGDP